jgi:hypothetical protein
MTKPEGEKQQRIGMLVLEQAALERQIGKLRDEISQRATIFAQIGRLLIFQPERLVFEGQSIDEQFAGEAAIDRKAMDVDSLLTELRAAIVRKKACAAELAEAGIDFEEAEHEHNLRASRALFHPANVSYRTQDRGVERSDKRRDLGFSRPGKRRL